AHRLGGTKAMRLVEDQPAMQRRGGESGGRSGHGRAIAASVTLVRPSAVPPLVLRRRPRDPLERDEGITLTIDADRTPFVEAVEPTGLDADSERKGQARCRSEQLRAIPVALAI